jgi:hypothetical protein
MILRACASGTRGSRQCNKSRYKVVVIQGTEGSVRLGRINTRREHVRGVGVVSATNCFVSS